MVVRFYLEGAGQSVTDVHQTSVLLARLHQHLAAFLGQRFQPGDGVLVAAMLTPHHRENAQFGEVGRAAQDLLDALELFGQQAQFLSGFYCG